MIIYDLKCIVGHQFEGWFGNPDDFKQQAAKQQIACPVCDSIEVEKLPTASRVNTLPAADRTHEPNQGDLVNREQLKSLHKYIEENFDNVGTEFAEEVRRIHYGETGARNINGEATQQEVQELSEEGIYTFPIPGVQVDKDKLN